MIRSPECLFMAIYEFGKQRFACLLVNLIWLKIMGVNSIDNDKGPIEKASVRF